MTKHKTNSMAFVVVICLIGILLIYNGFQVLWFYGISKCVNECVSDSVRVSCAFSLGIFLFYPILVPLFYLILFYY